MDEENNRNIMHRAEHDPKVDAAMLWLQRKKDQMEAELTLRAKEIGDYLIDHFFEGDISQISSQNPNKNVSFRRLCERLDLPFPETALRRFIHVAINFRLLPEEKAKLLPPSHHSVLYQVADPEERREIGIEAVEEGLSVRELRRRVKGKGRRAPGAGRKKESDFTRNWKAMVNMMDTLSCEEMDNTDIDPHACRAMMDEADKVKRKLEEILRNLENLPKEEKQ